MTVASRSLCFFLPQPHVGKTCREARARSKTHACSEYPLLSFSSVFSRFLLMSPALASCSLHASPPRRLQKRFGATLCMREIKREYGARRGPGAGGGAGGLSRQAGEDEDVQPLALAPQSVTLQTQTRQPKMCELAPPGGCSGFLWRAFWMLARGTNR